MWNLRGLEGGKIPTRLAFLEFCRDFCVDRTGHIDLQETRTAASRVVELRACSGGQASTDIESPAYHKSRYQRTMIMSINTLLLFTDELKAAPVPNGYTQDQ